MQALKPSPEIMLLTLICVLAMGSSAVLFHYGLAVEWNPLLRPFAEAGVASFVSAKSLTFVPCVVFMEWLRRSRPRFVALLLRGACTAYVGVYASLTALQLLRSV